MSEAAVSLRPSPWIVGRWVDLLAFVASPVWILLLFAALQYAVPSKTIQYGVLAFGSVAHNLPGMLRAYGDRALFRRFRTRFVVAPIALIAVSLAFAWNGSPGLLLIAYLWSIWHALMQHYGFLRIYDVRVGATSQRVARLDFALTIAWFCGAVVFSDARVYYILSLFAEFAPGSLPAAALNGVRIGVAAGIGAVTIAWLVALGRQLRRGEPVSSVKLVLFATSFAFWWYVHVFVSDVLLGLVMFEVWHDVQYLAIVWLFNLRRADRDPGAGAFTRFLFRRRAWLVAVYVGMCWAYGGGLLALRDATGAAAAQIALAMVIQCSALLHYYFDGFLWKVREQSTQDGLGIAGRAGRADRHAAHHGWKWGLLAAPALVLWSVPHHALGVADLEALAAATPRSAVAHHDLGVALTAAGQPEAALRAFAVAQALVPGDAELIVAAARARGLMGLAAVRAGDREAGERAITAAAQVLPGLADEWIAAASELDRVGDRDETIVFLRAVTFARPQMAAAHLDLALVLRAAGRPDEALEAARRGASLVPDNTRARDLVRELAAGR